MAKDGYRQLKTSAAQTAANAAVKLVEGRVAEGGASVVEAFNEVFDAIYAKLEAVVIEDNIMLAEQEAAAPAPKSSGKAKSPAETVFTGGKFKGKTIKEVFEMSESDAKSNHGHTYGDGASYITGYVATDKNSNQTTREAAQAFLASV